MFHIGSTTILGNRKHREGIVEMFSNICKATSEVLYAWFKFKFYFYLFTFFFKLFREAFAQHRAVQAS